MTEIKIFARGCPPDDETAHEIAELTVLLHRIINHHAPSLPVFLSIIASVLCRVLPHYHMPPDEIETVRAQIKDGVDMAIDNMEDARSRTH